MSERIYALDAKGRPIGYGPAPSRWRLIDGVFENDETVVLSVQRRGTPVRCILVTWPGQQLLVDGSLTVTAQAEAGGTIRIPVGCLRLTLQPEVPLDVARLLA